MNLFLTQSPNLGNAKVFLLKQIISTAAKAQGHHIVDDAEQAELAIVFGETLPNLTALRGKKVFLANPEQTLLAPETLLASAQSNAVEYIASLQSAVNSQSISSGEKNIVAVTACPTGVAHTFLSAEAIQHYSKKMGWNVRVETRGQVGTGTPITDEEVAAADLVFIAADIDVDLSKFVGKPMYRTSTGLALKKTEQEFNRAFAEAQIYNGASTAAVQAENTSGEKKGVYKHLMTGVSHMLPMVVAGGLLIAISFMFGPNAFEDPTIASGFPTTLMEIGRGAAFKLMIAVFAGYVAYSIADRPGLAVGLIGGMLATTAGSGILGGIIAGFLSGYVVKGLNATIKLPASMTSLKPILILPLLGSAIVGLLMVYLLNPPVATAMNLLGEWLKGLGSTNSLLLGALLGGMMCVDMGGPVNKAAYVFGTGLLASQLNTPMAAVMAGGMVPPIGMAIATWIAHNKFNSNQRNAGNASFVLGLCFISEGTLPFVAADPIRVIGSSIIGGAIAGAISLNLGIELPAPHGGLFVIPLVSQPLMYLGAITVGSMITGVLYALIRPKQAAE